MSDQALFSSPPLQTSPPPGTVSAIPCRSSRITRMGPCISRTEYGNKGFGVRPSSGRSSPFSEQENDHFDGIVASWQLGILQNYDKDAYSRTRTGKGALQRASAEENKSTESSSSASRRLRHANTYAATSISTEPGHGGKKMRTDSPLSSSGSGSGADSRRHPHDPALVFDERGSTLFRRRLPAENAAALVRFYLLLLIVIHITISS